MGMDLATERRTLLDEITTLIGHMPDPVLGSHVLLGMSQWVAPAALASSLDVPEEYVQGIVKTLSEVDLLEWRRPREDAEVNDEQRVYRLPIIVMDDHIWTGLFGPRYLVEETIPKNDVASVIHSVEERMNFSYKKRVTDIGGEHLRAPYEPLRDEIAQLEERCRLAIASELGVDPRWQGLPSLIENKLKDPKTSKSGWILFYDKLTAQFNSPSEAVSADFEYARGTGTALKTNSGREMQVTVSVDKEADGYKVILPNYSGYLASTAKSDGATSAYQREFAAEQLYIRDLLTNAINER